MNSYERYVEEILKLQKCYRVQNILHDDAVSKIDLIGRPRVSLTLAIALWSVTKIKQSSLSYSDVVYLQRRLAYFLSGKDVADLNVIKRLFELIPMRYGMNVALAARRCSASEEILTNLMRALNMLRDVVDMVSFGLSVDEPLKHSLTTCLNDTDLLPPTAPNPKEYLIIMVKSLKENLDRIQDPLLRQVAQLICEETEEHRDFKPSDIVAIALIIKLLVENLKSHVLCVEPSINIATLSQKILNDLIPLGAVPYDSTFYKLYQEISARSIVTGSTTK
ncbi:MAG: hypothetical protein QW775_06450 [Ignisphaera sp.]|uniref:Uncharacterized protein n=1 Tax=Ignisphaera aggregans TaxID=334771 RepID=A0A7C4JKG2_9CREN